VNRVKWKCAWRNGASTAAPAPRLSPHDWPWPEDGKASVMKGSEDNQIDLVKARKNNKIIISNACFAT